jgi:hypothetical protein
VIDNIAFQIVLNQNDQLVSIDEVKETLKVCCERYKYQFENQSRKLYYFITSARYYSGDWRPEEIRIFISKSV